MYNRKLSDLTDSSRLYFQVCRKGPRGSDWIEQCRSSESLHAPLLKLKTNNISHFRCLLINDKYLQNNETIFTKSKKKRCNKTRDNIKVNLKGSNHVM